MALFFIKAGAFTFGSGLAIVPFLHEGLVDDHRWLTEQQFVDAVAMGLISPGPVVIMATFAGYIAFGIVGALVATAAVFLPVYLFVVIPGAFFRRYEEHPRLRGFIKGATAAASGAIAGAAIVIGGQVIGSALSVMIGVVALAITSQAQGPGTRRRGPGSSRRVAAARLALIWAYPEVERPAGTRREGLRSITPRLAVYSICLGRSPRRREMLKPHCGDIPAVVGLEPAADSLDVLLALRPRLHGASRSRRRRQNRARSCVG